MREEKSSAKCLMGGTSPQISGNKAKIVDPELITARSGFEESSESGSGPL
jgi:hypothetical protein